MPKVFISLSNKKIVEKRLNMLLSAFYNANIY